MPTIDIPDNYFHVLLGMAHGRGISIEEVIKQAIGMEKYYWDEYTKGNKIIIEDQKSHRFREIVRN